MSVPLSIQKRFTFWVAALVLVLVGAIIWVIQKREVAIIFDEFRSRALLTASNLADVNRSSLLVWDVEALQADIDAQIDENRLYIVFFDRYGTGLVASRDIAADKALAQTSQLQNAAGEAGFYAQAKDVYIAKRIRRVLEVEVPIFVRRSEATWGSVKLGLSLEPLDRQVNRTRLVLILIGAGGLLFGSLGASVLARRITKPIKELADGTVRIARGEFSHRIAIDSRDEIGHLARDFNDMSDKLRQTLEAIEVANRKLVQSEKLAQIGRMAATIAHEIRNPLTSVKLNIQKVRSSLHLDETEQEHMALSEEGIAQIERFIKELLNFTRVSDLQMARFGIEQVLDESVKLLKDVLAEKGIVVERRYAADLPEVLVDGDRLRQVFANILRNSAEALPGGGRITITTGMAESETGRRLRIRIADSGAGIPEKDWENIFEPFFTTKPQGFGLGLANARKIVEQHKGTIKAARKRGPGAAFEIELPCEGES
ncbi:MAG: ATP-binding protein [Acidobacteriota bacterium]|nr:ATP-binding protein [Acidobacteriota bacterium]